MKMKEYMTIRKNIIFHDIRKEKQYEKIIEEIIKKTKIEINDLNDLKPIENNFSNSQEIEMMENKMNECFNLELFNDIFFVMKQEEIIKSIENCVKNYIFKIIILIKEQKVNEILINKLNMLIGLLALK